MAGCRKIRAIWPRQPPGCGASPSEGGQGGEWAAYVALARTAKTYRGMAYGARALRPRSVRSSRGSNAPPGRAGKPLAGRRDTGVNRSTGTARYAGCGTPKPNWRSSVYLRIYDTGEPSAVNVACSVREGAVGKGPGNGHLAGGLLHVRRLTRRQIAPAGGRGSGGGDLWATRLT